MLAPKRPIGSDEVWGFAIAQSMAWAGWSVTPESEIRLGAGAVKALRGDLRSGVFEISWTRALGLGGR